jgi:hypothetical protein
MSTPPRRLRDYRGIVFRDGLFYYRDGDAGTVDALTACRYWIGVAATDDDHAELLALRDNPEEPVETLEDAMNEFALVSGGSGWSNSSSTLAAWIKRIRAVVLATQPQAITPEQAVAWWIGPHDGLLAGATTNKNLADARIEHGATVRPLVFGDVAPSAGAGVTDEMVTKVCERMDIQDFAWVQDIIATYVALTREVGA